MDNRGFAGDSFFEATKQNKDEITFSFELRITYKLINSTLIKEVVVYNKSNDKMYYALSEYSAFAITKLDNVNVEFNKESSCCLLIDTNHKIYKQIVQ